MKSIKYIVPNTLTACNMICGALAIVAAFKGYDTLPVYFLFGAAIFDFLDGFVAKLIKATSEFGKQLDSLADLISFGFAPSVLLYILLESSLSGGIQTMASNAIPYWSFLFLVFAALRLARFNIQISSSSDFTGLPVPAATLVIVSVWLILKSDAGIMGHYFSMPFLLIIVLLSLSAMMVSKIKMLSLKFKGFSLGENLWRYLLLSGAFIIFLILKFDSLFWIMVYYLFLSVAGNIYKKIAHK